MKRFLTLLASVVCLNLVEAITCPDGWTTHGGSCYFFGRDGMSFYEADQFCKHVHGHLVHIETDEENAFLRRYLNQLVDSVHWIGLTDELVEKVWQWSDTDEHVTYTGWATGQPDMDVHHNCAGMGKALDYHWGDYQCPHTYNPICELTPISMTTIDPGSIVG